MCKLCHAGVAGYRTGGSGWTVVERPSLSPYMPWHHYFLSSAKRSSFAGPNADAYGKLNFLSRQTQFLSETPPSSTVVIISILLHTK